jgi:NAD+ kinase
VLFPCVLVVKTPVASRKPVADRLARTGRRLAGEVADAAQEQEQTMEAVQAALAALGVAPVTVSVNALDAQARRAIAGARLVVTVGGDGTLLAASHWVTGAALLGVNSAPRSSVGYLTFARRANVARILTRIAAGTLLPQSVARLEIELEGKLLPPALNDVLVAHEQPAATSRYRLRLGRRVEEQRSSGLWIATAAGSTAGIRSAGGQATPLISRRLQFRARELYRVRDREAALDSGFVEPGEELVVESAMEAGWLFPDGARLATRFPFGARAVFRVAEQPLRLFADARRWARLPDEQQVEAVVGRSANVVEAPHRG